MFNGRCYLFICVSRCVKQAGLTNLLFPHSPLNRLQFRGCKTSASSEVSWRCYSVHPSALAILGKEGLTRSDLCIDLNPRISRYQVTREFNSFQNRNPFHLIVSFYTVAVSKSRNITHPCPTIASCFILQGCVHCQ